MFEIENIVVICEGRGCGLQMYQEKSALPSEII